MIWDQQRNHKEKCFDQYYSIDNFYLYTVEKFEAILSLRSHVFYWYTVELPSSGHPLLSNQWYKSTLIK